MSEHFFAMLKQDKFGKNKGLSYNRQMNIEETFVFVHAYYYMGQ